MIYTKNFSKFGKPATNYLPDGTPDGIREGLWRFEFINADGSRGTFLAPSPRLTEQAVKLMPAEYNGVAYFKLYDAFANATAIREQIVIAKALDELIAELGTI
jgi:hypothetical protein